MKIVKGYIYSRPFLNERVPQHIQNIILRNYCKDKNLKFLLSATEYSAENSSYIFFEILDNLNKYDGILLYSIFQLPTKKSLREKIYSIILKKKKFLLFAVEDYKLANKKDIEKIEQIFLTKLLISKPNKKFKLGKVRKFVTPNHLKTKRNYIQRMNDNKILSMKISKKYSFDYWDGDRKFGYGGYKYIKDYFKPLAKKLIKTYNLTNNSSILDIGCGKGFLLFEIKKLLPKIKITGCDNSNYAIKKSKTEIKKFLFKHDAKKTLNFKDKSFDLVISINMIHNLKMPNIEVCLKEIERLGNNKFICFESYRNEKEQFNVYCWALTAETLIDTDGWKWIFKKCNYTGDYEFIFF
jgi:sporadic carbohydrate cluster protein (TIGR04323 family)